MSEYLKIPPMPTEADAVRDSVPQACYESLLIDRLRAHIHQLTGIAQAQARRADEAEETAKKRRHESWMNGFGAGKLEGFKEGRSLTSPEWDSMVAERDALKAENVTQRDEIGRLHHEIEGWKAAKAYAVDEAVRFFNLLLEVPSTLAQRDREVLALREGIDRFRANGGRSMAFITILEPLLKSTAQAGAEAERRVLEAAWERVCFHLRDTGEAANLEHQGIKAAILGTEPNP